MIDPVEAAIAPDEVRDVLAAAADVLFSDGISPALLDQWTAETCFLLRTRLMTERNARPTTRRAARSDSPFPVR